MAQRIKILLLVIMLHEHRSLCVHGPIDHYRFKVFLAEIDYSLVFYFFTDCKCILVVFDRFLDLPHMLAAGAAGAPGSETAR